MSMRRAFARPLVTLALLAAACGGGVILIGTNKAFPNALVVVVPAGGTPSAPTKIAWGKASTGETVDALKELLLEGPAKADTSGPLSGAVEVTDLPAGIYTLRMRKRDASDQNCGGTYWMLAHGDLQGGMSSQATGPCANSTETIKAGETLKVTFSESPDGVVLVIVAP